VQLIKSVDTLSAHLERMFASHAIDRMVLMFGSSCANPKEIYVSVYVVRLFQVTGGSLLSTLLTIVFARLWNSVADPNRLRRRHYSQRQGTVPIRNRSHFLTYFCFQTMMAFSAPASVTASAHAAAACASGRATAVHPDWYAIVFWLRQQQ